MSRASQFQNPCAESFAEDPTWQQLAAQLDELEKDRSVRGVVFRSGLQKDIFTAGNDITELYAPKTSLERYRDFWVTQNTFLAKLYRSRLVTVAAIRGACPARGCNLALSCDYRVMTDFGNIGLNEVALGIPVPAYWAQLMQRTIGQRNAEKLLPYGVLATAEEEPYVQGIGLRGILPAHKTL